MCSKRIADLSTAAISPLLRSHGFSKKSNKYNRRVGTYVDVVEVQLSRWNDDASCTFTINLGVADTEVFEACWGKQPAAFIAAVDCIVRARLGQLIDPTDRTDRWWRLDERGSDDTVAEEIVSALANVAIPWFKTLHTGEGLEKYLDALPRRDADSPINRIYRAVLKWRRGDKATAARLLSSFERPTEKAWRERAEFVQQRLSG